MVRSPSIQRGGTTSQAGRSGVARATSFMCSSRTPSTLERFQNLSSVRTDRNVCATDQWSRHSCLPFLITTSESALRAAGLRRVRRGTVPLPRDCGPGAAVEQRGSPPRLASVSHCGEMPLKEDSHTKAPRHEEGINSLHPVIDRLHFVPLCLCVRHPCQSQSDKLANREMEAGGPLLASCVRLE